MTPAPRSARMSTMTITVSADRLHEAALGWMRDGLAGFVVYRSKLMITVTHTPCGTQFKHPIPVFLMDLVREAIAHECEAES